jgi:hypothetical protein
VRASPPQPLKRSSMTSNSVLMLSDTGDSFQSPAREI